MVVPDLDEKSFTDPDPARLVERLALAKAVAVAGSRPDSIVIGSDTIVVLEGQVLNKPADPDDAFRMLRSLSGRTHTVYTGYALVHTGSGRIINEHRTATVTFRVLADDEIRDYIATGSPLDKAGSYGIQDDHGAVFIDSICGDYYSVVGLPLMSVYLALRELSA